MYQQTLPLPLRDDFSVQVQMSIFADTSGYMAYISTDLGGWQRFRIGLKPHDVEELNMELQDAIEQAARAFEAHDEGERALSKLAQKGAFAFKRIFTDGVPREIISKTLNTGATLQIVSEHFFLPWELLYTGPLGPHADASCFWGMQHIISRALIQDAQPGALKPPLIHTSCPQVGLITCDELEQVVKKEIPMLQQLHQQKKIFLLPLRSLNADQRDEELDYVSHFLRNEELHIIHFACHAYEKQPKSQSYLRISDKFAISVEDFFVRDFEITHNPFVILNACLTGTISPLHTSNWAALFWEHGARGVLATEFHIPDRFAAEFTEELYKHFLSEQPIGDALLNTRRYFWEQRRNPLGLAYALYSSPSIRITTYSQGQET